jgi:hypothetical protein
MSCYANVKPKPTSDGQETNGEAGGRRDEVVENVMEVIDRPIGYCRYGHGPNNFLFICGGVGECLQQCFVESQRASNSDEVSLKRT